jgi:hypothetical protein
VLENKIFYEHFGMISQHTFYRPKRIQVFGWLFLTLMTLTECFITCTNLINRRSYSTNRTFPKSANTQSCNNLVHNCEISMLKYHNASLSLMVILFLKYFIGDVKFVKKFLQAVFVQSSKTKIYS